MEAGDHETLLHISQAQFVEALDAVTEAMRQIYDAKQARTATANDDVRLKELHVQWMAVMRKFLDESADDYAAQISVGRKPLAPSTEKERDFAAAGV